MKPELLELIELLVELAAANPLTNGERTCQKRLFMQDIQRTNRNPHQLTTKSADAGNKQQKKE